MNRYLTLALVGAGLVVSASAFAAKTGTPYHGPYSQAVFEQLDTNGDHKLSAAEMTRLPAVLQQLRFERIDTNHDGKIEQSEFTALAQARAARMFGKLDTNGDGVLSPAELKPPMPRHAMKPTGKDVPASPSSNAGTAHQTAWHGRRHADCRHHKGWHARFRGEPRTDWIFARMDTNNDGYVSLAEWNAAAQRMHRHHRPGHTVPGSHPAS